MQEPAKPGVERLATTLPVVLPVLVIIGAIFLANLPAAQPPQANIDPGAEPLPIEWISALALSRRGVARFVLSRALVLGGCISYAL